MTNLICLVAGNGFALILRLFMPRMEEGELVPRLCLGTLLGGSASI